MPRFSYLITILLLLSIPLSAEPLFEKWDKNKDGFLTKEEVPEGPRAIFDRKDKNGDGKVSLAEHTGQGGGSDGEKPERKRPEGPSAPEGTETIRVRQVWHQEPDGFERIAHVRPPLKKTKNPPVLIVFHGNGGSGAGTVRGWQRDLPEHLIVCPDGYERSWNIYGEKSQADDVDYFRKLIATIGESYPDANLEDVSLVGSSNGGGMIHRYLIEIDKPLFKKAIPLVASLLEHQYREEAFWMPKKGKAEYTEKKEPTVRPKILYIHGTEDSVVPFEGGYRGKELHLPAPITAHAWATAYGFRGDPIPDEDAEEVSKGLLLFDYKGSGVQFVKAVGGNHGLGPYNREVREMVTRFITED